jgi:hypothetical protein
MCVRRRRQQDNNIRTTTTNKQQQQHHHHHHHRHCHQTLHGHALAIGINGNNTLKGIHTQLDICGHSNRRPRVSCTNNYTM